MDNELKKIVDRWLIKAGKDLTTIEQLLNYDEIVTDSICFHAQQAIEKFLKAYLVSNNISPEKHIRLKYYSINVVQLIRISKN